jgi:hypothetical protein
MRITSNRLLEIAASANRIAESGAREGQGQMIRAVELLELLKFYVAFFECCRVCGEERQYHLSSPACEGFKPSGKMGEE